MAKAKTQDTVQLTVSPPKIEECTFRVIGTAPLVIHRFSQKALIQMLADQTSTGAKKKKHAPKKPEELFKEAQYIAEGGWSGIHAAAFRMAMIRACSLIGYTMTMAKMSVFIEADGIDADDGTPLVKIINGKPEMHVAPVTLQGTKKDVRIRPMWRKWEADVRIKFDLDQFSPQDVAHLLMRAGTQVGICEGRPLSKNSAGCGWGTFSLKENPA